MHTWTHKTHHDTNLGEATTFLFIVLFVTNHMGCTQISFFPGLPSWESWNFEIGILAILEAHNFLCKTFIEVRSKAKLYLSLRTFQRYVACHLHPCNLRQFLTFSGQKSNWHLTPRLSFSHNLCYKYWNGSCEPNFGIYVSRSFQWYNVFFNPMSFDLQITLWKFESLSRFQLPKWESTWECVSSFAHNLSHSHECECDSWVAISALTVPCPLHLSQAQS
jgi:hypothetical protein